MRFDITRRIQPDFYEWRGRSLQLDCSYDNVFRVLELMGDDAFNESERVLIAIELLILNAEELEGLTLEEFGELFLDVLKDACDIDMRKEVEKEEPVWDIHEDGERIYSSFLKDYGIDLFEQQGVMHYRKFVALLLNLHEDTSFKKVVGYRVMKVPKLDKYNADYHKHILDMKKLYKLGDKMSDEERQEIEHQRLMSFAKGFMKGGKANG